MLYEEDVEDVHEAERLIHARLADCRWSANREFFLLPLKNAVRVVADVCAVVNDRVRPGHRIVIWNATVDANALKKVLKPYLGGTTWVMVGYRNAEGECVIRLPAAMRVRWNRQIIDDLRRVISAESIVVTSGRGGDG